MKRLLIIPVLLFAFAANAEDAWPPEWFKEQEEKYREEAVRLRYEYCNLWVPDYAYDLGVCPPSAPPPEEEEEEEEEEGEEEAGR